MDEKRNAFLDWLKLFPEVSQVEKYENLSIGLTLSGMYQYLSGQTVDLQNFQAFVDKNDWFNRLKVLRTQGNTMLSKIQGSPYVKPIDFTALVRKNSIEQIDNYLSVLLGYSKVCPMADIANKRFSQLPVNQQNLLDPNSSPSPSHPIPNSTETQSTNSTTLSNSTNAQNSAKSSSNTAKTVKKPTETNINNNSTSETTNPAVLNEINAINEQIKLLMKENETLKAENETLRTENEAMKAQQPSTAVTEANNDAALAKINAEIFTAETKNELKEKKKLQLLEIQSQYEKMQQIKINLEQQLNQLQEKSQNSDSKYKVLCDRLQKLQLDPKTEDVQDLLKKRKKYHSVVKKLQQTKQQYEAKIDGLQELAVLKEREKFANQVLEQSKIRQKRAAFSHMLMEKKLKIETFELEMKSFL